MNRQRTLFHSVLIVGCFAGATTCSAADAKPKANKAKVDRLISQLNDPDESVCETAAWRLRMIGDKRAGEPLIALLKARKSEGSARAAAYALGDLRESRAAVPLVNAMKTDPEYQVRAAASYALGKIGGKEAVKLLIELLDYKDRFVVRNAARALGEIGDKEAVKPLVALLKAGKGDELTGDVIYALGNLGAKEAAEPILAVLKDKKADIHLRYVAAEALSGIRDKRAIGALRVTLKEGNLYLRACSAQALAMMGDKGGVEATLAFVRHENRGIRVKMVRVVGEMGDRKHVPAVIALLEKDDTESVRSSAAWALGRLGGQPARAALKKALGDGSAEVREAAQEALRQLSVKKAPQTQPRPASTEGSKFNG